MACSQMFCNARGGLNSKWVPGATPLMLVDLQLRVIWPSSMRTPGKLSEGAKLLVILWAWRNEGLHATLEKPPKWKGNAQGLYLGSLFQIL